MRKQVQAYDSGKRKCLVIGAGELTTEAIAVWEGDLIIAVDGGVSHCSTLGVEADIIIGDMDSLSQEYQSFLSILSQQNPEKVIRLSPEKDDTDMLAALKYGLQRGYRIFHLHAAAGGRLDHTLGNIQCLLYLKNRGAFGCIYDAETQIFLIQNEEICFPPGQTGRVSLFALGEEARGVTLEGLKYPLTDHILTNDFPLGISNEFLSREARIRVESGTLLCMVYNG